MRYRGTLFNDYLQVKLAKRYKNTDILFHFSTKELLTKMKNSRKNVYL